MTAKTRILLVIAGLPAGGAERQMALLARRLDRTEFEVGLLVFNAEEKVHFRDVFDVPLWFRALGLSPRRDGVMLVPRLVGGIRRAVDAFGPDAIHTSLNVANHATRVTALIRRWKVPIVTSVRADFRAGYRLHEKLLERLLWRRSARIICNSDVVRGQLMEDLSIPADRVVTVPNGIDDLFFQPSADGPPAWWPPGRVALTVGRFKEEKNHLGLLAAIAELKGREALDGWHFVLLGEGPLEPALRDRIRACGLEDRVILAPPQTDLAPLYRAARLFVLPSVFEGMSNALLEATASACPVAVTPGANRARIIDDSRGWILDAPLAQSLHRALSATDAERAAAGARAATHAEKSYSAQSMVAATAEIYRHVVAADRAAGATPAQ